MTALIVADDFTGACDAAVAFSPYSPSVHVLAPGCRSISPQVEVCAISTESRHIPLVEIESKVLRAVEMVAEHRPRFLFKKIDSVFRGNTFAEIAAWANAFPDRLILLAPAYPGLGRKMCGGNLLVNDLAGKQAIDVHAGLSVHSLPCRCVSLSPKDAEHSLADQMQQAWTREERLLLCDAANDEELHRVVDAGLRTGLNILWIGSAGLTHALAHALADGPAVGSPGRTRVATGPSAHGPILYCIGSPHAVTARQIAYLKRADDCVSLLVSEASSAEIQASLRRGKHVLLRIGPEGCDPGILADRLCPPAGTLARALVVSGGETAAMVCRALEIDTLELRGELLPGVPWGILQGGRANGLLIATKSGGFGPEHALTEIASLFKAFSRGSKGSEA